MSQDASTPWATKLSEKTLYTASDVFSADLKVWGRQLKTIPMASEMAQQVWVSAAKPEMFKTPEERWGDLSFPYSITRQNTVIIPNGI